MSKLSWFERWWLSAWPHRMHIQRYIPRFLKASPEPFRGEVLEVGAGSGWTSRQILESFPQVELTATDLDPRAVAGLDAMDKQYGNRFHVRQANILDLPFDRNSFDMVIAAHAMHHVDDLATAVQQFLRVLRPGGLIGIVDEDQNFVVGPMRWLWTSQSKLSRSELEELLKNEGAEIQAAEGDVHFILWARKPYPDDRTAKNNDTAVA